MPYNILIGSKRIIEGNKSPKNININNCLLRSTKILFRKPKRIKGLNNTTSPFKKINIGYATSKDTNSYKINDIKIFINDKLMVTLIKVSKNIFFTFSIFLIKLNRKIIQKILSTINTNNIIEKIVHF